MRHSVPWDRVRDLLASQRFAVLATQAGSGPYCSLIAFWAADDLSHVLFTTMRATRKFGFLTQRPHVALLFDDRSNRATDLDEAAAVTATGTAREVGDEAERAAALSGFLEKHPSLSAFAATAGCALIRVDIDVYYLVTRFQETVELRVRRAETG